MLTEWQWEGQDTVEEVLLEGSHRVIRWLLLVSFLKREEKITWCSASTQLRQNHVTEAQSHVSFGSIRVTAAVNWPRGNAGPRWGLPLILPQVRQSHAIRCTACIAPLLISKWQRRQCVAMCTWGQGLIAFFQFSPRCVVTSRSHSAPNRYWSFLFKADAF